MRRVVWPLGQPERAVIATGWLGLVWWQFRLGFTIDPRKLRRVVVASHIHFGGPVATARHWEAIIKEIRL